MVLLVLLIILYVLTKVHKLKPVCFVSVFAGTLNKYFHMKLMCFKIVFTGVLCSLKLLSQELKVSWNYLHSNFMFIYFHRNIIYLKNFLQKLFTSKFVLAFNFKFQNKLVGGKCWNNILVDWFNLIFHFTFLIVVKSILW